MKNTILILSVIIAFSTSVLAGGPWTNKKGSLYSQLGYTFIPKTNALFFQGTKQYLLNRPVFDRTIQGYFEYGLFDRFTLIGSVPFKSVGTSGLSDSIYINPLLNEGNINSFGNIEISGKYQLSNSKIITSVELNISSPSSTQNSVGIRTGYNTWGFAPAVYVGYGKDKFYAFSKLSYNIRTEFHDEFQFEIEYGKKLFKQSYLMVHFDLLLSTMDKSNTPLFPEQTGLYSDGQEYSSITLKYYHEFSNRLGFIVNSTAVNFHGHLVQRSPAIGVSLFKKFLKK